MNNRNTRYPRMHGGNDLYLYDKVNGLTKSVTHVSLSVILICIAGYFVVKEIEDLKKDVANLKSKETTREE